MNKQKSVEEAQKILSLIELNKKKKRANIRSENAKKQKLEKAIKLIERNKHLVKEATNKTIERQWILNDKEVLCIEINNTKEMELNSENNEGDVGLVEEDQIIGSSFFNF